MANQISNVGFTDYGAEQAAIDRRRKIAEMMTQQGMAPFGSTESVGGWAIPRSPMEGIGRIAQTLSGAYQEKNLQSRERALATRYQTSLAHALQMGEGSPGAPAQPPTTPMDDEGNPMPGVQARAAVPPDRAAMIRELSGLPGFGPMAVQQSLNDMNMGRMANVFGYGGQQPTGAAPAAAPAPMTSGQGNMPPAGTSPPVPPAPSGQSAGELIPRNIALGLLMADPSGKLLAEKIAAQHMELNKPLSTRYGIFGPDPSNPGLYRPIGGALPQGALPYQFGAGGTPDVRPYPGQVAGVSALTGATKSAEMPYSMNQMDVPVYLPGGDQITVKMNATQAHQYQTTGQLPPEIASSIPGLRQGSSPETQPAGSPAMGSVATLGGMRNAVSDLPVNPPGEPAIGMSPLNLNAQGQPISPQGRPVVGRTQSQSEQITQQRQAAGGKSTDEAFSKDYLAFRNGGASDAARQLAQLKDVAMQLAQPKSALTGPYIGSVPDALLKFTETGRNAIAMKERVDEVVQRSLRAILGAQFTEKEGERLIARAYNPNLNESENAIRVNRLLTQLTQAFQAKQSAAQHFERNGTLQGWQGKLPSINDFDSTIGAQGSWKDL